MSFSYYKSSVQFISPSRNWYKSTLTHFVRFILYKKKWLLHTPCDTENKYEYNKVHYDKCNKNILNIIYHTTYIHSKKLTWVGTKFHRSSSFYYSRYEHISTQTFAYDARATHVSCLKFENKHKLLLTLWCDSWRIYTIYMRDANRFEKLFPLRTPHKNMYDTSLSRMRPTFNFVVLPAPASIVVSCI